MVREGILPAEETKFYKSTKIVTTIVGTVRRYVWGACQSYYIANEYYRFYFQGVHIKSAFLVAYLHYD